MDKKLKTVVIIFAIFSVITIPPVTASNGQSDYSTTFVKCCDDQSVLNENLVCEKLQEKNISDEKISYGALNVTNNTGMIYSACFKTDKIIKPADPEEDPEENPEEDPEEETKNFTCVDVFSNGTKIQLICKAQSTIINETIRECDNLFTQIKFWGATMVVFATMVYNVPFIIVVVIYCAFSELRTRAYDKGVICYNLCYILINFQLITLGLLTLCHKKLSITTYRLFGLGLMFTVQGSVIWILILCFDMTLVITRFRWAPKSGVDRGREEKKKFIIYSSWAWGFSGILTLIATIVEFTPIFPEDSPIRPNFHHFREANVAVIIYVITGPAIVCLTTTSLFIYTTVKTIAVQKSTAIINENRKANVMKRYFLFLKLYLVMDTPWLTSALAAIFHDLWVLKFIKMVQPIVMLMLILPRKRILRAIDCRKNRIDDEKEAVGLKKNSLRKDKSPD